MENENEQWEKIISREDFWKNYSEEFGVKGCKDSLSVERFIDMKDILKNNPDEKFKFAIAKIRDNRLKPHKKDEKKFFICPEKNHNEKNEKKIENLDSLRLLSLVITGYYHTFSSDENYDQKLRDLLSPLSEPNYCEPSRNFEKLYNNTQIRDKHNKIVEEIFEDKLKNIVEKDNDYSLFLVIDQNLYEFCTKQSKVFLINSDISEAKIRDKIYAQLKELGENFDDITIFKELSRKEDEEISSNDTKQIIINIILTIIFVINFFYVMPPNIFFRMNNALGQFFEYDKNGKNVLDSINNWAEVSDYYMGSISNRVFSTYNKFNFTTSDETIDDQAFSIISNNSTDKSNFTELKTISKRYYLLNTNLFCGMMINFVFSEPIQIVDVNGSVKRKRQSSPSYYKVSPTKQSVEFLTFKWQENDPVNPNSYYLYFNPSLNRNILATLNQQLLRNILVSQDLYEFSITSSIYNSDYKISAIYSLKFHLNSYGFMEKKRFFMGYQPFLSTSTQTFSYLLIINIIFVLFLIYVIYLIMNSFSNNIIELIINKNYQFEWFEWLDLLVVILTITSEIILFKFILFDSKLFKLENSSLQHFQNVNENIFQVRNYLRLTGVRIKNFNFRFVFF
jgi:hypothetical protein